MRHRWRNRTRRIAIGGVLGSEEGGLLRLLDFAGGMEDKADGGKEEATGHFDVLSFGQIIDCAGKEEAADDKKSRHGFEIVAKRQGRGKGSSRVVRYRECVKG